MPGDMKRPTCSLCSRIGATCEYPQYERRRVQPKSYSKQAWRGHSGSAHYPYAVTAHRPDGNHTPPSMSSVDWLLPSQKALLNLPSPTSSSVQPCSFDAGNLTPGQTQDSFSLSDLVGEQFDPLALDPFGGPAFIEGQGFSDVTDNGTRSAARLSLDISSETVNHLLDLNFDNVQPLLPLLHRPKIRSEFFASGAADKPRHQGLDLESALLLNAMISLSARFSPRGSYLTCHASTRGDHFAKAAQELYATRQQDYEEACLSLRYLQGCILLTFYQMTEKPSYKAWEGIGVCSRLAHALAIHEVDRAPVQERSDSAEQWAEKEERRRAWWIIYEMDNFASFIGGRPYSMDSSRTDVLLPVSDEAWFNLRPAPSGFISARGVATAWRSLVDSGNQEPYAWFLISSYLCRMAQEEADKRDRSTAGLSIVESAIQCFVLSLPSRLRLSWQGFGQQSFRDANWVGSMHLLIDSAQTAIVLALQQQDPARPIESGPLRLANGSLDATINATHPTNPTTGHHNQKPRAGRLRGMCVWSADHVQFVSPFMAVALVAPAAAHFAESASGGPDLAGDSTAVLSELEGAMIEMVLNRIAEYWGIGAFCMGTSGVLSPRMGLVDRAFHG
ncbi:fungal-specific transcription factor domain-containing protein [Aspergillus carlsbadensis]|nr:fungal-specific transcription factor domain-containing protein [Aspergillus carlsbadensis]